MRVLEASVFMPVCLLMPCRVRIATEVKKIVMDANSQFQ